jgi:hypothetical protein
MMPDGSTRFFLFDLEGATINTQVSPHRLAAYYAETAVHKLDNVFDFEQIQRFESQGYTLAARTELAKMLVGDELLDKAKAL